MADPTQSDRQKRYRAKLYSMRDLAKRRVPALEAEVARLKDENERLRVELGRVPKSKGPAAPKGKRVAK